MTTETKQEAPPTTVPDGVMAEILKILDAAELHPQGIGGHLSVWRTTDGSPITHFDAIGRILVAAVEVATESSTQYDIQRAALRLSEFITLGSVITVFPAIPFTDK